MTLSSSATEPVNFAVVGHPNKGKSSVVAALTRHDQVAISEISGTTTQAQAFSLTLNGETLYTLVDTPGFQRPRQMLEHMTHQAPTAAERKSAIIEFIEQHQASANNGGRFKDEIELLTPIMAGANIIYVVDGSIPYSPEYEAEMTILQWTGAARMALINPIQSDAFLAQWQAALGQYFSVVKVFNPMHSSLTQHISILKAFEAISPNTNNQFQHIHQQLLAFDQQQNQQAAFVIAEFMQQGIGLVQSAPLVNDSLKSTTEHGLQLQYKHALTACEEQLHQRLNTIYQHTHVEKTDSPLTIHYPELFDQDYWYLFGLSRTKLIALSASGGALAGAALDIAVGGTSLLMGSLIGGLSGAAASTWLSQAPDKISIKNLPLGGKKITIGPVKNLQFCFVLLGRALNYQRALKRHSHADRGPLNITQGNEWLNSLDKKDQVALSQLLMKSANGLNESQNAQLQKLIAGILASQDSEKT